MKKILISTILILTLIISFAATATAATCSHDWVEVYEEDDALTNKVKTQVANQVWEDIKLPKSIAYFRFATPILHRPGAQSIGAYSIGSDMYTYYASEFAGGWTTSGKIKYFSVDANTDLTPDDGITIFTFTKQYRCSKCGAMK